MNSKKGAIELSMTTVIVIIIGVTLLTLGIVFVRNVFDKSIEIADNAFIIADKELQNRIGSTDKIYVPGVSFEIESGKATTITVGVQNFKTTDKESSKFKLQVQPGDTESAALKIVAAPEQLINVGDIKGMPVEVGIPKGAPPGKTYSLVINVLKDGQPYDSQSILVKVKE